MLYASRATALWVLITRIMIRVPALVAGNPVLERLAHARKDPVVGSQGCVKFPPVIFRILHEWRCRQQQSVHLQYSIHH